MPLSPTIPLFSSIMDYFENANLYKYGSSIYENLSFYGKKLKVAENTGQFYKIVPLTLGSFFGYQSLKNFTRGAIGYDSWDARKKMIQKAANEKELPYTSRLTLIRDSFFGSMKGKQRALTLAKGIANALIAGAFLYPFFAIESKPSVDLNEKASAYPNDKDFLEACVTGRGRGHYLDVGVEFVEQYGPITRLGIHDPIMSPKTISYIEGALNPNLSPMSNSVKTSLKSACEWTLGWTAYNKTCATLPISDHQPIFTISENRITIINETSRIKACANTQAYVTESVPSLGTQAGGIFETICDHTLGYTPWAKKCSELRAHIGPSSAEKTKKLTNFVTQLCNALKDRVQLQDSYETLFGLGPKVLNLKQSIASAEAYLNNEKLPSILSYRNGTSIQLKNSKEKLGTLASVIVKLGETPLPDAMNLDGSPKTILGLTASKHPEFFDQLSRNYMNITTPGYLNRTVIGRGYRNMQQQGGHKIREGDDDNKVILGKAAELLFETFKRNPNLYTRRSTYTLKELFNMFIDYVNAPFPSEEL